MLQTAQNCKEMHAELSNKYKNQETGVYVNSVSESCPDSKKYIEATHFSEKIS